MGVKLGISYAKERPVTAPLPLCGDFAQALACAKEWGFDAIEIHGREQEFSPKEAEVMKKQLKKQGMKVSAIATGRLYHQTMISLTERDSQKRAWLLEQAKRYVDGAAALETDVIIGWLRGGRASDISMESYYELLADSVAVLDQYGTKRGVRILLEAINRYEVDSLITAGETLDFINRFQLVNTYLHLDVFHMNIEETNLCQAIRQAGERLGYLHLADNTRLAPGTGTIDFSVIFEALKQIGYDGYGVVECFPHPTGQEAARMAGTYLKRFMHV